MIGARRLELAWSERRGHDCLCVRGWTEAELCEFGQLAAAELRQRLAVYPSQLVGAAANVRELQSIAGHFEIDRDAICFVPRFPFSDGASYSLLVDSALEERDRGRLDAVGTIQRPARAVVPTTDVVAISPGAHEVPANLLKLYVQFSHPMSEGWAARAIHVRRADNDEPLTGVFLSIGPELWDREHQRLTLLLDPGRNKRGLVPHEQAGYPLIEGVPVVVTIDAAFCDAAGQPLRASAERRYEVGPPLNSRVEPADWQCHAPAAGSRDPLTVAFDRPLDRALVEHSLWVHDGAGVPLRGRAAVGQDERWWRFEPQAPWEAARYAIIVDCRLEDLAGNSVGRVFDRDLARVEDAPVDARSVAIDFTCAPR